MSKKRLGGMKSINQILLNYGLEDKGNYITQEFQDYGYRLAIELDDEKHKALYIKLAKKEDRLVLEKTRTFVLDAKNVRSKGKLFMWKLKQLKDQSKSPPTSD